MKILKLLLITSVSLVACSKAPEQTLPDFKQMVMQQYIMPFKQAETDKWMQVFADDAVGMHNTLPAFVGKTAIRQFGDIVAANLNIEQMDVNIEEIRVSGNWAFTRGTFTSKFVPKNMTDSSGVPAQKGKFILLWEKQSSGEWKVILDMGNSNEAPNPS